MLFNVKNIFIACVVVLVSSQQVLAQNNGSNPYTTTSAPPAYGTQPTKTSSNIQGQTECVPKTKTKTETKTTTVFKTVTKTKTVTTCPPKSDDPDYNNQGLTEGSTKPCTKTKTTSTSCTKGKGKPTGTSTNNFDFGDDSFNGNGGNGGNEGDNNNDPTDPIDDIFGDSEDASGLGELLKKASEGSNNPFSSNGSSDKDGEDEDPFGPSSNGDDEDPFGSNPSDDVNHAINQANNKNHENENSGQLDQQSKSGADSQSANKLTIAAFFGSAVLAYIVV